MMLTIRDRRNVLNCIVSAEFKIWLTAIRSDSRVRAVVEARHVSQYLSMRNLPQMSYAQLGRLTDMDHTSVMHGVNKITARVANEPAFAARIARIEAEVQSAFAEGRRVKAYSGEDDRDYSMNRNGVGLAQRLDRTETGSR